MIRPRRDLNGWKSFVPYMSNELTEAATLAVTSVLMLDLVGGGVLSNDEELYPSSGRARLASPTDWFRFALKGQRTTHLNTSSLKVCSSALCVLSFTFQGDTYLDYLDPRQPRTHITQ